MLFMAAVLLIQGCAATSPDVEDNFFISHNVPKLLIKVSSDLPFITSETKSRSGEDMHGSLATIGMVTKKFVFKNYIEKRGLIIFIEKFKGAGSKWEMADPDGSFFPGLIVSGTKEMNSSQYYTEIYLKSYRDGQYIKKSYERVIGKNIRFTIHYIEKVNDSFQVSDSLENSKSETIDAFIQEFSTRADNSFAILPYSKKTLQKTTGTEVKPLPISQPKEKLFIEIQEPDTVFSSGKVKFTVNQGDVLEVVTKKTCRGGRGECWIVRHVRTGESGAVSVKQMHSYHRVYSALEPEIDESTSQKKSRLRTYIEIKEPDKLLKGGKVAFLVTKGDKLEVLLRKTCKSGQGECWLVRDLKTGNFGYVKADSMRSKHIVYEKPEGK